MDACIRKRKQKEQKKEGKACQGFLTGLSVCLRVSYFTSFVMKLYPSKCVLLKISTFYTTHVCREENSLGFDIVILIYNLF